MSLNQQACIPCKGGIPPLTQVEAEAFRRQIPDWQLIDDATKLNRTFKSGDFASALAFVNAVGALAEAEDHHPDISFGWGYCEITIYTHKIKGLHENDFVLAAKISNLPGAG